MVEEPGVQKYGPWPPEPPKKAKKAKKDDEPKSDKRGGKRTPTGTRSKQKRCGLLWRCGFQASLLLVSSALLVALLVHWQALVSTKGLQAYPPPGSSIFPWSSITQSFHRSLALFCLLLC